MDYVKLENRKKETCYGNMKGFFGGFFFFLDAFISSAVRSTALFILYGESMALMPVRFFVFCFIFLKKWEI